MGKPELIPVEVLVEEPKAVAPKDFYALVDKYEASLIVEALETYMTVSNAARSLKLNRTTLTEKMRRHGITNIRVIGSKVITK